MKNPKIEIARRFLHYQWRYDEGLAQLNRGGSNADSANQVPPDRLGDFHQPSGKQVRNPESGLETLQLAPYLLISCRIEKAKELLIHSKMTVTDISMEVGYNSLSKFISTFKKIVGSLPSDFRTSQ